MPIVFRSYNPEPRYGNDYTLLRRFLLELDESHYPFGRWDWMISHSYLNPEDLSKIGMWFDGEHVIAISTYDTVLDGNCYFALKDGYKFLCNDMIAYAQNALAVDGKARLLICDGNTALQKAARDRGYIATQSKEYVAVFDINNATTQYTLPEGFTITSMGETYNPFQYGRVLWKGFNHEINGEGPYSPAPDEIDKFKKEFERPNLNLHLKVAAVSPNGDFVSYCGMWQDDATQNALVEPVATDPAYRKMGLGRAVVLEAIRRCGELGAKKAFVGSSQQFYYSIGFRPYITSTFWERKA